MCLLFVYYNRFHAYSVVDQYEDNFDSFTQSLEADSTSQPQGRGRGDGMPSLKLGIGVREDVITLWEELDEARNTLAEIQALLCEIGDPKETPSKSLQKYVCSYWLVSYRSVNKSSSWSEMSW